MRRREWFKAAAGGALAAVAHGQQELPKHPRDLVFPKLTYDPPDPAEYRHQLDSGAVAYLVEDHQLPLVSVSFTVRAGSYQVPKESAGLASFTGSQIRSGGTATRSARDFDEDAAFLATQIGSSIGGTSAGGSVNCLKQNLDASLGMFFDMLKNPGFDPERFEIARARSLQGLARRNDRLGGILSREFRRLTRADHFTTVQSTQASIQSITREQMQSFHARHYDPRRLFFSVAGDFETKDMLRRLNGALAGGWPSETVAAGDIPVPSHEPEAGVYMVDKTSRDVNQSHVTLGHFSVAGDFETKDMLRRLNGALAGGWPSETVAAGDIPVPSHEPEAGVYMVDKTSRDVNQSHVTLGHLGIERSHPDAFKVRIMNSVLGGGGFTSRIMLRVRSDEGLAYSAYSQYQPGTYYPGVFRAGFQSRNATCAQAAAIIVEEIERMQNEKVTAQELDTAKNYQVEIFPRFFATAGQVAGTFANDEFTGREKDYWKMYRERIADVSADDVLDAAQHHLHPQKLVVLAVGDMEAMLSGNPDQPGFSFESSAGDAGVRSIPLPDPLTMEYPEA
jgi:predicted Zn-dependent peptidase